jgi:hypothetical protein
VLKLGIAVSHLGASQLGFYLARSANALLAQGREYEVVVFYQDLQPPCFEPRFSCQPIQEAFGFDGVMVATSFATAQAVSRFPSASKRLWYLWDLDWLRMLNKDYRSLAGVYRDERLSVLARSEDHAKAFENVWLRPVAGIVPDFDLQKLLPFCDSN